MRPDGTKEAYADYYPETMSDISVWKGLCSPRTDEHCRKMCGDRPCGYYKEILKRGIDLDAMNSRPHKKIAVDVTEEEIAALKEYRREHGMKIEELCEAFRISRHTYINYTKGRPVTPRIKGVIRRAIQEGGR